MAKNDLPQSHVALLPAPEMGHLIPFLRLSSKLSSSFKCTVTLITFQPSKTAGESKLIADFFSENPLVQPIDQSLHLLGPLLGSSTRPISAIFSDLFFAAAVSSIARELGVPFFVLCTTSGRCHSLVSYLPKLISDVPETRGEFEIGEVVEIPGLEPLPKSLIPSFFLDPDHPFTSGLLLNARSLPEAKGVLMNSFHRFEPESIAGLNGEYLKHPPVFPIGPFESYKHNHTLERGRLLPWLDEQSPESVVYVSFGSRAEIPRNQITEIRKGLERSGFPFLWVINDSEEKDDDNYELKGRGMVVREWVEQEAILAHPAIGGFLSHCGWNSVTEAARFGVPILAWPQNGDQRMNAEVVEKAGLGVWVRRWCWCGQETVKGEEIGEKVREAMENVELREKAREAGEEARRAVGAGGSSKKTLVEVVAMM
ncbi:hypothetical protein NMG60_11028466 [Bertholletia excelsa]